MSSSIVSKFTELDYKIIEHPTLSTFPVDLQPFAMTEDGVLIETLSDDTDLQDALFTAYGKLILIQKYIQANNLNQKYSVLLVLAAEEFRNIHQELRKSIYSEIPFIVL